MGLTQTKLHHKVLQENWGGICRRLQTEDGKKWVKTINPCGDYPLHLACYGGQAPPIVIRALVAAHPAALSHSNMLGYKPLELAQSNYRRGHPFRQEVLEYLEAYAALEDEREQPPAPIKTQRLGVEAEEAAQLESTYVTSTTCVVCLEKAADHVVAPCGHMCLCGGCALRVLESNITAAGSSTSTTAATAKTCPVCRSEFDSILRVFVPGVGVPPAASAAPMGTKAIAVAAE